MIQAHMQALQLVELALACMGHGNQAAAEAVVQLVSALNSVPVAQRHPRLGPPLQQALLQPLCMQVRACRHAHREITQLQQSGIGLLLKIKCKVWGRSAGVLGLRSRTSDPGIAVSWSTSPPVSVASVEYSQGWTWT